MDDYARYKYVMENIRDVIWEVDKNAVFTFISPAIKGMAGYTPGEMLGHSILEFLTHNSREYLTGQLKSPIGPDARMYDVEFVCKGGRTIWSEVSVKPIYEGDSLICYVGISRDVSEKRIYEKKLQDMLDMQKSINAQLEDLVTYDSLTGAYNRRKFEVFAALEIEKKTMFGSPFSISIFDVDNFKQVNDFNGHSKGDRVLQEIAALIKRTLRESDKLFRWGGDEFIVLFPDTSLGNALKAAAKLKDTVQAALFDIRGRRLTISMGVGAYAADETPEEFVIRIDKALLRAKNNGKNIIVPG
jgi:diguanylate cyclase (GGDEF)-like protein/PAS domain S-box-containing protein